MGTTATIITNEAELRGLLAFASKDDARLSLHCIVVSGGRMAATDGHALAVLGSDPSASWAERCAIPYGAVLSASVLLRERDEDYAEDWDEIEICAGEGVFSLKRGAWVISGKLVDVITPKLDDVLSVERNPAEDVAIDPGLVARLMEIGKVDDDRFWRMSVAGKTEPVKFTTNNGRWTVLIMPGKWV